MLRFARRDGPGASTLRPSEEPLRHTRSLRRTPPEASRKVAYPLLVRRLRGSSEKRLVLQAVRATLHARIVRRRCDSKSARDGVRADLLTPFLHVTFDEVLGVLLEHAVDLVEKIVELFLQLLALLGGREIFDFLVDAFFR